MRKRAIAAMDGRANFSIESADRANRPAIGRQAGPADSRNPGILVVGDVMLDRYLDGVVERISPEAPVPVLHVRRSFDRPGGAANVAVNVAAMEGVVLLVGAVGDDDGGRQLRVALEAEGVPCGLLVTSGAVTTTVKTRLLAGHNQIARFDQESPIGDDAVRAVVAERARSAVSAADLVLISDYVKGVCDDTVVRAVIDSATARGVPIVVDSKSTDYARFRGASVITPNRNEAAAAAGFPIRSPADGLRAARLIRERHGIESVVVTLGEQGMAFVAEGDSDVIPTQARQVYDVTGAGDSVVAAVSVAIGRGMSIRRACLLANAAAGLQVARIGTSRVTWGEMLAAAEPHRSASHEKIVTRAELRDAVRRGRAEGRRIGFTNGCFDILHHGHVQLLEAAARECDLLVVGVNSDASVTRLKGPPRPFVGSADRQAVLAGLASVGLVCEFSEDTPLEIIREIEPDVLIKGGDYRPEQVVGGEFVLARGGRVVTPLFVPDASTTEIVERVRRSRAGGDPRAAARPSDAPSRP